MSKFNDMFKSSSGTTVIDDLKIPKYVLIFQDDFNTPDGIKNILINLCGYSMLSSISKVQEIQQKKQAVVLTGTLDYLEDTYNLIEAYSIYNDIRFTMIIREEN